MSDIIRKQCVLGCSRDKAWEAVGNAANFGAWFGVDFEGPFVAGEELAGRIVPTQVDPEVAKLQEPHKGTPFRILVTTVDPPRCLAFRWHPYSIDPSQDYSSESTTLVSFELSEQEGGTLLTITESGFDQLPAERSAVAYQANEGGWEHQTRLIGKYVDQSK